MAREHRRLQIADLFPYESAGVSGAIVRHKRTLEKGHEMDPVEVLEIDGEWLVINGTNRVIAAKQLGLSGVAVKFVYRHPQELGPYREALDEAKAQKRRGFENVPVGGQGERADSYRAAQPSTIDEFLKRLDEPDTRDEQ